MSELPSSPTAQGLAVAVAWTPKRALFAPPLAGLCIIDHLRPFQCISMAVPSKVENTFCATPTAHALAGDTTVTESSTLMSERGSTLGVDARVQEWPFQRKASEWPWASSPTSQTFDAELALRSLRSLPAGPAAALRQAWPFQCRMLLVLGVPDF